MSFLTDSPFSTRPTAPSKSALTKKEVPAPSKSKGAVKKPVLTDPSSDSDPGSTPDAPATPAPPLPPAEFSSKAKGKEKAIAPSSPASPSLHNRAARNKRSPPHSSKDRHKANRSPIASGSKVTVAATPAASLAAAPVDNTIYMWAFHLQVDLQFHEPPSHQALEYMKLSMLPLAPDSLTKPPTQVQSGQEYVYQCHSDINPHFIHPPLLTSPCYNCTLSGYPEECEFKGEVGEEVCSRCKTGRHGPCSVRWDANQLRCAATLLDPLTLSSDGGMSPFLVRIIRFLSNLVPSSAICHGINRVERINAEIALLGRVMHCLREDREKIVGELADGLEAIASREHGTEIVDAYAQISNFLKSFIIRLGEAHGGSDAEGVASDAGAT
ncbi:hypothetical protein EDD85DRAFT_793320 [Armillaria nabsnona]|nr:hypothetical protein EDD85DRAFT_793320 [Armillaria nabsnona]